MVKLYSFSYQIDGKTYSFNIPCSSWEHAESLAIKIDAKVDGTDIYEVSAINPQELIDFVNQICLEPPKWLINAEDQLLTFLSVGHYVKPNEN